MALMQQTRLQDADITECVKKDVKHHTRNPLKAPNGSPAKSLRTDSETPGRHLENSIEYLTSTPMRNWHQRFGTTLANRHMPRSAHC